MVGEIITHYSVGRRIGGGGMGIVYEAEDVRLGRRAALKFLPEALERDPAALERLQREARAASSLNHPNICTIYEIDEHNGRHFIAMELLEGRSLSTIVANGPMPPADVLDFAVQIADALDAAHTKGVVHRDLKPANLYITNRRQAKILDFGLAKVQDSFSGGHPSIDATAEHLTSAGTTIGTVAYMSPEQARGEALDGRSDLFSLGAVLYEMLTGALPFKGTTSAVIFNQILEHAPIPPSRLNPEILPPLEGVVLKLLEKDRDLRYQSAAELRSDLRRLKRDSESGKTAAIGVPPPPVGRGKNKLLWIGVAVVAVLGASLLLWRSWERSGTAVPQSEWTALTDFTGAASQPALSPDGHMLAFIRAEGPFMAQGDLFVKLLPNGNPVQLTHDNASKMTPVFSPDGSQIAYTVLEADGAWNTYVVPVLGGEPRLLLPNAAGLIWTGEHQFLFSEIDRGIHMKLVSAEEGRANERDVYVPPNDYGMAHLSALSPDRRWVLLLEMDERGMLPCRVVPFDGKDLGHPVGPLDGACDRVAWTPDGRWMLMTVTTKSGTHLWRQRFPDGKPEQLTFGTTDQAGIAVTFDGSAVITADGKRRGVVMLHDSKGERQITSEGSPNYLRFAQDGKKIFFVDSSRVARTNQRDEGELRAYDVTTGETQSVLPGIAVSGYHWTRDGKRLVYSSFDGDLPHTWIAPLDHSSPPREINKDWSMVSFVSPDDTVYYVKKVGAQMYPWKMDIEGGNRVQISSEPGMVWNMSADQQWSIVWAFEQRQAVVYLQRNSDKHSIKICSFVCGARWAGPERFVVAVFGIDMTDSKTYVFKVTPTNPVPPGIQDMASMVDLDRFAKTARARILRNGGDVTIDPTSDAYAYTRRDAQRNLYRIPLPR